MNAFLIQAFRSRGARAAILTCACLASTSCAVVNPYVVPRDESGKPVLPVTPSDTAFAGNLAKAITEADHWRMVWYAAAGDHARFKNLSATLVLPLTAAALFNGITGNGSSDEIARLSLGAGTIYGANAYLTSAPRPKTYLAGAAAMSCAILASRPLLQTNAWVEALATRLKDQDGAITELVGSNSLLAGQIEIVSKAGGGTALDRARQRHESAARTIDTASDLHKRGNAARHQVETSGFMLGGVVRKIADQVGVELSKIEPDLESLRTIAGGLLGYAKDFSGGHLPEAIAGAASVGTQGFRKSPADESSSDIGDLEVAEGQVATAQLKVVHASATLQLHLDGIADLAAQVSKVEGCGEASTLQSAGISVQPSGQSFTLEGDQTLALNVTGGTAVPRFSLVGTQTDAVAVNPIVSQVQQLVLSIKGVKNTSGPGTTLIVSDGSGNFSKEIQLIVKKD